ncbi:MAG: hydrogenase maturation protease [Deltaproteobacteria bacterium]|nr:hydrogenase maturation protease [Deltaproteobacteria bacterium]
MLQNLFDKSVLIFGCGNILFGDDGFGPAVADHLQQNCSLPPHVLVMDVGTSIREILFDLALSDTKPEKLIVIDAVDYPNRRPGELFEIPVEGIPAEKVADFSLHQFPTVNILKELRDHTGIEIKILAAQVEAMPTEVRPGLSGPIREAVGEACRLIMENLQSGKNGGSYAAPAA